MSSHEMMAIVILTGCHVVTLSSRYRGVLQNVAKEPAKLVQIPRGLDFEYTKGAVFTGRFPKHKYT